MEELCRSLGDITLADIVDEESHCSTEEISDDGEAGLLFHMLEKVNSDDGKCFVEVTVMVLVLEHRTLT